MSSIDSKEKVRIYTLNESSLLFRDRNSIEKITYGARELESDRGSVSDRCS